jgi:hypothetical protein
MITVSELSVESLCKVLADAGFDFSVNSDGHIYIRHGLDFPMWIDFHKELSTIQIFTYAALKASNLDEVAVLDLVNRMNMNFVPNQVHYYDKCIYSSYTILAYDNISERSFLSTLKRCAEAFLIAAQKSDTEGLFQESTTH